MPARILVIEDHPDNLRLMTYLLCAFGHEVLVACDGEEALAVARKESPDLILCDIQIPKLDGYEVARILKKDPAQCHVPLVAITALAMLGDRDRILAAGFDGYIAKPIIPKTFAEQTRAFLKGPHPSPGQATAQSSLADSTSRKPLD